MRQALTLGLRCTSTSMRNKWTGLLPKLLRRIFMAVHAALNRQRLAEARMGRGRHAQADLQISEDLPGQSHSVCTWSRLVGYRALSLCL